MKINMKTKFINGTNKQYSIREDGQITKLFYITRSGKKHNKPRIIKITNGKIYCSDIKFRKKGKTLSHNKMLFKYFNYKICGVCNNKFYPIESKKLVCISCGRKNANYHNKKYRLSHVDEKKKRDEDYREKIGIGMITVRLKIKKEELTPEIIKTYRETLMFKRKVSKELNVHIHTFNT